MVEKSFITSGTARGASLSDNSSSVGAS